MKRLLIAVTFLLVVGAGGMAWNEARRAQDTEHRLAEVGREMARTSKAIQALEQRLAAADRAPSDQQTPSTSLAKNETSAPALSPASARVAAMLRKFQESFNNPTAQAVRLASGRAKLRNSHGVLFRRLGLTPAQMERFQDITARRDEQKMDLNEILRVEAEANGIISAETGGAVSKLMSQVDADYEAGQRALLGEEGFRELREYGRTVETRTIASELAGAAVVAGVPFTAQQAEQLTQVLANASSAYREGGEASVWTIDWNQADEQARGILSEPQWTLFKTIDPPLSNNGRFNRRYNDAMSAASKAELERKQKTATPSSGG